MNYTKSAAYYDLLYSGKDYAGEALMLREVIQRELNTSSLTLLDVACGTGKHLEYLKNHFSVEGLDIEEGLLDIARQRLPEVKLQHGDMRTFKLPKQFDVITCLFSAIGYMIIYKDLCQAIEQMTTHLRPQGLLVVEPWFTPDQYQPGTVHMLTIDQPELKIARMNTSMKRGRISVIDFHYLVGTDNGTTHFSEMHKLALYTQGEMEQAFRKAGLEVSLVQPGLTGRGLYLGKKL